MDQIASFLALLLPIALSPGPVTIAIAGLGMSQGILRAMPFFFGVLIAGLIIAVLSGMGLTGIFMTHPMVYIIVRYAGLAYIVYLASKFIRARPSASEISGSEYTLFDGMLVLALNPKFYLLVTVLFSQFLKPGEGSVWVLVAGVVAVLAFSQLVWLAVGAGLKPLLRSEKALRVQSVVFGLLMLAVAVYLFLRGE